MPLVQGLVSVGSLSESCGEVIVGGAVSKFLDSWEETREVDVGSQAGVASM